MTHDGVEEIASSLYKQAEDLCHIHDHSTRIIRDLEIDTEYFADFDSPYRSKFPIEGLIRMFIYQNVREMSQSELARRLSGIALVYQRFGLKERISQQVISYNWRHRFRACERTMIKQVAKQFKTLFAEHNINDAGEPPLEPDDVNIEEGIGEDQVQGSVKRADDLCFDEFNDPRASNTKYSLSAFFERQGYLNLAKAGTTTKRERFARLSDRTEVPHGSTHNRTMKKIAEPEPQTKLWDFNDGGRNHWEDIRDEVLPTFHAGVENVLDEIAESDRSGIREPVNVAFDITTWSYWSSPFRDEKDVEWGEEPVVLDYSGRRTREVYPKADYPEMVSGVKESHRRAYKFATLTTVSGDTPIVLAIEPVRDHRNWEPDCVKTRSRAALVDRLLEQAERHVDINKVFADREFDTYGVRHHIDQRDQFYMIGKRKQAIEDQIAIEKTVEHSVADVSVEHGTLTYDGETHDISFMYVPKDTANDDEEYIEGDYAIFTVNAHVSPDRAIGLTEQYRDRWIIENEYKSIKEHFLPTSASADYRNRFLFFVIGVTLHNVWRLANFLLRDEVDVDLGEDPPIMAGEIVELVGFCLFDPGG